MAKELVCWKCGSNIAEGDLPISRRSLCRTCNADLHTCIMCKFYNPKLDTKCGHLTADAVREKERANFCDHFRPRKDAHKPVVDTASEKAKAQLASLFGDGSVETDAVKRVQQEKDKALSELEKLFGNNENNNNHNNE
ncbi:MAG: hypothetical protein OEW89_08125 [Gammaproteobacteria bacterium]|nr:hypothetical protein [Gammaproteobacteria bacterium]MDH5593616.1 hypothetical protein [Gammaproteobacteria bacterium]